MAAPSLPFISFVELIIGIPALKLRVVGHGCYVNRFTDLGIGCQEVLKLPWDGCGRVRSHLGGIHRLEVDGFLDCL
ncbi:hypothetical protein BOW53_02810 [Solemya pervernicosa gill symbiont]|uniref:Uncharacterized protein n=1 Tax=Solemya pervernicosa gill symbiont TaxID=642797 RepID=A0A1T2L958_9GAMM|nr:hypothetical protein BOW53_02810 [Solemya pervernicosa gill symbiont]